MTTDGRPHAPSQALAAPDALATPTNGARAALRPDRPPALVGRRLPGRWSREVREKAVALFWENPHWTHGAWRAACRYVELSDRLIPDAMSRLNKDGLFKPDGQAYDANGVLLGYMRAARDHEKDLGLTPVSRAALGLDLYRMRSIDAASRAQALKAESEDVDALEQRVIERLRPDTGDDLRDAARAEREQRDGD